MKNLFYLLIVFLVFACTPKASLNQNITLDNSTLWKIEGKSLKNPSYLFGTMHITCNTEFPEKVNTAFAETNNLVMEVNLADPKQMLEMMKMMQSVTPISKELKEEEVERLHNLYKEEYGISVKGMDKMGLMALESTILTKMMPCKYPSAMEMLFVQKAKKQQKTTAGLETFKEQLELLSTLTDANEMYEKLLNIETYRESFLSLNTAYQAEDLNSLKQLMFEEMDEEELNVMLNKRNQNWLTQMPEIMKEQPTFFAVGAGHLVGEQGVIKLLQQAGFSVTPVL